MKIRVTYYQNFMGKRIKDSYIRYVNEPEEIDGIVLRLYEDPVVYLVETEILKEA